MNGFFGCFIFLAIQYFSLTSSTITYLQCFGDLTQVYWQWVTIQMDNYLVSTFDNPNLHIQFSTMPTDSTTQYNILNSVYFSEDIRKDRNLQLDLMHINTEWNNALNSHFAIWSSVKTKEWSKLYDNLILESSKTDNVNEYTSKPDWIDFPILFYNQDLLWRYNKTVPKTWQELFKTALFIQNQSRLINQPPNFWGYLFSLYQEDITCVFLEFVRAFNGGNIIESDGTISVNNNNASSALELLRLYFGNITDPNVLAYNEQEILDSFLVGNVLFVRGWYSTSLSYIDYYSQGNKAQLIWNISRLPSYGTLGGVNIAINKYSVNNESYSFSEHITSFESSIYKWNNTQIMPPYSSFLDNIDSKYCDYLNSSYFGSNINLCSMNLTNLTSTYFVSRPSNIDIVGDKYDQVSKIIQNEVIHYLTGINDDDSSSYALRMIQCRLQYLLYSSSTLESVDCGNEIEINLSLRIICFLFSFLIIFFCIILIIIIIIYRSHPAISSTSVTFSIVLCIGAILMSLSIFCCTFNPYDYRWSCILQHIFYNCGFSLMFGSMFCSYRRVRDIFIASKSCSEIHIRDIDVFKYTGIVILIEILFLIFWFYLDSSSSNDNNLYYSFIMVNDSSLSFYYQCYLNSYGYLLINIYNTILVLYGMILAYQTRSLRYIAFRQSYLYSVIASLFFFTVIIVHPVYYYCISTNTGNSPNLSIIIFSLSTIFLISGTLLLIFSYKIYLIFKFDEDILRKDFLIPRKNTYDTLESIIEYSKSNNNNYKNNVNIQTHTQNTTNNSNSLISSIAFNDCDSGVGLRHRNLSDNIIINNNENSTSASASASASGDFIPDKYDIKRLTDLGWKIIPP